MAFGAESLDYNDYPQVAVATSAESGATWGWTSDTIPPNALEWPGGCRIWRAVCVSADGRRLAAAGVGGLTPVGGLPDGPVLVSKDSGASWVEPTGEADPAWGDPGATSYVAPWIGLAMSADGSRLTGVFLEGLDASDPGLAAQQAVLAPVIDVGVSAGRLVLSWVVPLANFAMQQSSDIGADNWTDVPGVPLLNYSTLREEETVPSSGRQMFFRLVSKTVTTIWRG